jgi:hypothetical protein
MPITVAMYARLHFTHVVSLLVRILKRYNNLFGLSLTVGIPFTYESEWSLISCLIAYNKINSITTIICILNSKCKHLI